MNTNNYSKPNSLNNLFSMISVNSGVHIVLYFVFYNSSVASSASCNSSCVSNESSSCIASSES